VELRCLPPAHPYADRQHCRLTHNHSALANFILRFTHHISHFTFHISRFTPPTRFTLNCITLLTLAALLAACGSTPKRGQSPSARAPATGGGYYLDDGPGARPPADIDRIPDAVPRVEPLHRGTQRPYVVMGRSYTPMTRLQPYRARGVATWYGRRYHGRQTASGEPYDMYGMTAAHTTLPIPSYVRVTHLGNGRSVVVRVNDRGPFIGERLIDLSYTAAHKLGFIGQGSAMVEVETIIPGVSEPAPAAAAARAAPVVSAPSAASPRDPVTAEGGGFYVQLGAFSSRENADNFLSRLRAQLDDETLTRTLHVFARDSLFRVHAGPYTSQSLAREAADRVTQSMGMVPLVLSR